MRIVYALVHNPTGKIYIGSTDRGMWRIQEHLHRLRNGKHKNLAMQEDYNRYGEDYTAYQLDVIPTNRQSYREYMWMIYFQTYDPAKGYNFKDQRMRRLAIDDFPRIKIKKDGD